MTSTARRVGGRRRCGETGGADQTDGHTGPTPRNDFFMVVLSRPFARDDRPTADGREAFEQRRSHGAWHTRRTIPTATFICSADAAEQRQAPSRGRDRHPVACSPAGAHACPRGRRPDSDAPAPRGRNRTRQQELRSRAHRTPADPNPAGSFPPLINQSISRAPFDNPTLAARRRRTTRPPARAILDLGRGRCGIVACTGREGSRRHRERTRSRRPRSCITIVRSLRRPLPAGGHLPLPLLCSLSSSLAGLWAGRRTPWPAAARSSRCPR